MPKPPDKLDIFRRLVEPKNNSGCLHCALMDVIKLSGKDSSESVAALMQAASDILTDRTVKDGIDLFDAMGQCMGTLTFGVNYYMKRKAR